MAINNKTEENGVVESVAHVPTIYAEPILHVGNFTITNALLTSWLAVLVIITLAVTLRRKMKKNPGKFQHIFEILIEGAMSLCDQVTNNRKLTNKIFPIVFTVFAFILVNNWVGIMPFIGSIGMNAFHDGHEVFIPFFRGGTADVNTTLALSLMAVIGSNVFGIFAVGAWKTFNKYVNLELLGSIFTKVRKDPSILIIAPVNFFVGILELIGEVAKVASLSFRLFGNIFAGEVLLASMAAIFAFIVPGPFLFLEVFIGLIQALIFSLLTAVYFTIAAEDHGNHEEEHSKEGNEKGELVHA